MLIRNAEVWGHGLADARIENGLIAEISPPRTLPAEQAFEADGAALLPGLHDHHIHLPALAAKRGSVWCGPPEVTNRAELATALSRHGAGWIRGIGYHDSVMGLPTASDLDELVADRPLRIQHRSGRMWLLNSAALDILLHSAPPPPPGLEVEAGAYTGRLFDEDEWLRTALAGTPPPFAEIARELASFGVTGLTDMSPRNDAVIANHFATEMASGALPQHVMLAGSLTLAEASGPWLLGPAKLHLHESALPDFHTAAAFIATAHRQQRGVAVHCVSEVELVFAIAAFETSGTAKGDRIEHASVASDELVARIAELGLDVCVQPHFIAERGDDYLRDVEPRHRHELYRLRAFLDAGISLAGGSDAPFGLPDPWAAISAATSRRTPSGAIIEAGEALLPEEALALYLADPTELSGQRTIAVGGPADLCLLDRPWAAARDNLPTQRVRATWISGRLVHDRVHQPPV